MKTRNVIPPKRIDGTADMGADLADVISVLAIGAI
jgi:hypothetical protein